MVSIQLIAIFLLIIRILSCVYIFQVIRKQWQLLRVPIKHAERMPVRYVRQLTRFRALLFFLSTVILVGNVIPVVIDFVTIAGADTGRPIGLENISIIYAFSNALTSLASSITISQLYRLAAQDEDITEYALQHLDDIAPK